MKRTNQEEAKNQVVYPTPRLRHFDRELGDGVYKNMLNVDLSKMILFVRLEVRGI